MASAGFRLINKTSTALVRGQYGSNAGTWGTEPPTRVEPQGTVSWSSNGTDADAPDGFVNYFIEGQSNEWVLVWWQSDGAQAVGKNGSVPGTRPPKLVASPQNAVRANPDDVLEFSVDNASADASWHAPAVSAGPGVTSTVTVPPAVLPGFTVILVGSPEPPADQPYQLQFVTAAATQPMGPNTIWLIERTGYEIYGVSLSFMKSYNVRYSWITPTAAAVAAINAMPDDSIATLIAYSHGVSFDTWENDHPPHKGATSGECMVALRYGWDMSPDYGITLDDIASISPSKFRHDATIQLNSCNSGTVGSAGKSIAQTLADRLGLQVWGWTGRTSYADINHGTGTSVRGSQAGWGDKKQYFDNMRGRTPVFKSFGPSCPVTSSALAPSPASAPSSGP